MNDDEKTFTENVRFKIGQISTEVDTIINEIDLWADPKEMAGGRGTGTTRILPIP